MRLDRPFILASASPRRVALLRDILETPFKVEPAAVEEAGEAAFPGDPVGLVRHNAWLKTGAVGQGAPEAWVLGADTTVSVDDRILNKPASLGEARAMLEQLSGREHAVLTGVALQCAALGVCQVGHCVSRVHFKTLTAVTIEAYHQRVNPLDKAGGYAIQEYGDWLVARYEGSWSNIMGLPVAWVREQLVSLAS